MYKLKYQAIARQDMVEIVTYISHDLQNPTAANKLAEEMVLTAEKLTEFPYVKATYTSPKPLKREYRKLNVKNYIMFYWVNEEIKTVSIARVTYVRRDYGK